MKSFLEKIYLAEKIKFKFNIPENEFKNFVNEEIFNGFHIIPFKKYKLFSGSINENQFELESSTSFLSIITPAFVYGDYNNIKNQTHLHLLINGFDGTIPSLFIFIHCILITFIFGSFLKPELLNLSPKIFLLIFIIYLVSIIVLYILSFLGKVSLKADILKLFEHKKFQIIK